MKNKFLLNKITDMKRIIIWSLNLIVVTFLFSACSQKLGLTKRHYNKGYYVESTKQITTGDITLKQKAVLKSKTEIKNSVLSEPFNNKSILSDIGKSRAVKPVKEINCQPLVKINSNTKNHSLVVKKSVSEKIKDLKSKSTTFELNNNLLTSSNEDSEDGLSLFWIVILILLLLWLFGYIILSGGLINLVLALALVLLILWLLRII
jgi:hypothetical protein